MLDELRVVNLGLIDVAHIEPGPGLVVVTGETGAGKTLLLGAVRLLTGEPGRRELVGPGGEEAEVHGRFVTGAGELAASRRITTNGRSRAYLDGEMVTARRLGEATDGILELVAQHDQLAITKPEGLRRLVDGCLDGEGLTAQREYQAAWERLVAIQDDLELIGGDRRALERELDVVRFQADEISDAGFHEGDDVVLQADAERLRNAETIVEHVGNALRALDDEAGSAVHGLAIAIDSLRRAGRYDDAYGSIVAMLEQASNLIGEAGGELSRMEDALAHDPSGLADVEGRLALLSALRRKYGESLSDVLDFGKRAEARAAELTRLLDRAEGLADDLAKAEHVLDEQGARLADARRRAAARLAGETVEHLSVLGFTDPLVRFTVEAAAPAAYGANTLRLDFASNSSLEAGPVGRVASGGELSRLVLALRLASGIGEAPVVAFDEIDAGVGGSTALALAAKLHELSRDRQVLVVTHLPQVAAFADSHYAVRRDGNVVSVHQVEEAERLGEISRMLAGMPDSEKGREHAEELLAIARGESPARRGRVTSRG